MPEVRVRTGVKGYEDGTFRAFSRTTGLGQDNWYDDALIFKTEAEALARARTIGLLARKVATDGGLTVVENPGHE